MSEQARNGAGIAVAAALLLFSSCGMVEPGATFPKKIEQFVAPIVAPKEDYHVHTVAAPGETLSRIAHWYTGSGNNWTALLQANPALDPRHIQIGDTVLIPDRLVHNRQPMPMSYGKIKGRNKPVKIEKIAEQRPTRQPTEVELFGPVDNETQASHAAAHLPLETIE